MTADRTCDNASCATRDMQIEFAQNATVAVYEISCEIGERLRRLRVIHEELPGAPRVVQDQLRREAAGIAGLLDVLDKRLDLAVATHRQTLAALGLSPQHLRT